MYYIKKDINLKLLEKYGFKIGREIYDNERCICNNFERDDYWLISDKLQKQADFLDKHNDYGMVYSKCYVFLYFCH